MEAIKDNRGGRRAGAGRKKTPSTQLRDSIEAINIPKIVKNLEKWSDGKEVLCPLCDKMTGVYVPDTVALQSAIELLNRRLGKPAQKHEIDITTTIQLNADQIDSVMRNHLPQVVEMFLPEILEILAQRKLLTQGEPDIIEGEVIDV